MTKRTHSLILLTFIMISNLICPSFLVSCNKIYGSTNNQDLIIQNQTNPPSFSYSSPDLQELRLNYTLKYLYNINGKSSKNSFKIALHIHGNKLHLENGTIEYYIYENVTDPIVLENLGLFFSSAHLEYFENHSEGDSLKTYFSYRRESLTNSTKAFKDNGTYSIFWLNTSKLTPRKFNDFGTHRFLNVENPYNLYIDPSPVHVEEKEWSTKKIDLWKDVRILEPYHLNMDFNNDLVVNLYYEKNYTVLLKSYLFYQDKDKDENFEVEFILNDQNFPIDYLEINPYHRRFMRTLMVILSIFAVGTIIGILYSKRKKENEKEHENPHNKVKQNKSEILDNL